MQFNKQSVFAPVFLSLLLIGVPANPQDADPQSVKPAPMPMYDMNGKVVGWTGTDALTRTVVDDAAKPLTPADQVEAAKKMLVLFAVDNRISQLAAEIKELQAQNAKNRKEFDDWQNAKRTEYGVKPEQSITLELQWSEPVSSK